MNTVEIDAPALAGEAAAALAAAPDAPQEPSPGVTPGVAGDPAGSPAEQSAGESWGPVVESITPLLREIVFCQWQVSAGQWQAWESGLVRSMDACFPGGIDGKYGGFVQAGLVMAGVTVTNYVMNGRKLPQLGPPRVPANENGNGKPPAAPAAAAA